jgi:hypothetical protein
MSALSSPGMKQVAALPISGSGSGNSAAAAQLSNVSVDLAATALQADADSKYDPKVVSGKPSIIRPEGFCSSSNSSMIMVVVILCIVYGVIAK